VLPVLKKKIANIIDLYHERMEKRDVRSLNISCVAYVQCMCDIDHGIVLHKGVLYYHRVCKNHLNKGVRA
jgi:hypothetical protein